LVPKPSSTSWTVAGLGALTTGLGWLLRRGNLNLGQGLMGFGLAHVVLGLLDMTRPTVRHRSYL